MPRTCCQDYFSPSGVSWTHWETETNALLSPSPGLTPSTCLLTGAVSKPFPAVPGVPKTNVAVARIGTGLSKMAQLLAAAKATQRLFFCLEHFLLELFFEPGEIPLRSKEITSISKTCYTKVYFSYENVFHSLYDVDYTI